MPHSSKKYKKQESKSSSRLGTKWTAVIVVVAVLIILPGLYFTYPPMSSAVQSMFGLSSNNTPTTATSSAALCATGCVYAVINTSQGVIEGELFQSLTPITVNNFVSLAQSGFYNNLVWHRIVKGFVIQTGDPNTRNGGGNKATWGQGGSNTTVPLETNSADVAAGY